MEHDGLRDVLREGIVEKSIQILRAHGKSDQEIKAMMLKDFSISEKTPARILSANQ
ncbi:MAG: hypothetical protein Q4C45_04250 [Oscillospiraceae bacterium]|nr:hypothetical protein [Oscillospiraceae bacterium]